LVVLAALMAFASPPIILAALLALASRALVKRCFIWVMLAKTRVNATVFQATGPQVIALSMATLQGIARRFVASTPIIIPPNVLRAGVA
jgi:hypothetical protein